MMRFSSKSQQGLSALVLVVAITIIIFLGYISFKLYIEPTKYSPKTAHIESYSSPSSQNQTLANPASVNCSQKGGILKIMKNGSGGEFGLCQFEDDQACEEWALMRGQCPVGGVKTIGLDNDQQAYCAWLGGETMAEENATCTLPGGKTCSVDSLWNGSCS